MRVCPFQDGVVPLMHEASVKAGLRPNEDYNGAKLVRYLSFLRSDFQIADHRFSIRTGGLRIAADERIEGWTQTRRLSGLP